jgi:hypothetical protein
VEKKMVETTGTVVADEGEVQALLRELSQQLLA